MNRLRCGDSWAWISAWLRRPTRRPSAASAICSKSTSLGEEMLETVNRHLASKGIQIATGTIVDATIIHAPSSTKNASGERDPEMHQTRKGNQWYFGLKAHIGVDSKQGVVHSVCTSAASVADCHMLPDLLHGEERKVWGDGGYRGQTEAITKAAPNAQDMTCRRTKFKNYVDEVARRKNTTKSKVRAKVEYVFRILKRSSASTRCAIGGSRRTTTGCAQTSLW